MFQPVMKPARLRPPALLGLLERVPERDGLPGAAQHLLPVLRLRAAGALAQVNHADVVVLAELVVVHDGDVQRRVADLLARDAEHERLVEDRVQRLVAH